MLQLDRARAVQDNFTKAIQTGVFPQSRSDTTVAEVGLTKKDVCALFESQLMSRHLDLLARVLKDKGVGFYTIGSSGHEGNAVFGRVFRATDMAFLHYRSGAFFIERARHQSNIDVIYDLLLSFAAAAADPIAGGRHKVFGSHALQVPPQTSTIASHLPKAVGVAFSLRRAQELKIKSHLPADSVILCSFGDASTNHSTSQGALNAAQWIAQQGYPLPLIFICEDNGTGISVPTPTDWIASRWSACPYLHYIVCDGLNIADVYRAALEAEMIARQKRKPVFLHLKTVRLMGHAGSDLEAQYRTANAIEADEAQDPLLHTARICVENHFLSLKDIQAMDTAIKNSVAAKAEKALQQPRLTSAKAVMASIIPPKKNITLPLLPNNLLRTKTFADQFAYVQQPRNMATLLNYALTDLFLQYDNLLLFGEDVGKKGGVYRVTADLQKRFGARRVFDTLLDEQTILGHAIGLAHNGFIPIPEIQFLAYVHNAEDQIRGEAATLSFFSNGQFTNPMVIRIAGLAYQKGFGGHFHNDNSIAIFRDIPGIILACPSNGVDAAKMLRACVALAYRGQRVVVFLEPIALYMTKDLHEKNDNQWLGTYPELNEVIEYGQVGQYGSGKDLLIISYGNGYYLSRQAEKILGEQHQLNITIVDLRWLVPLPFDALLPIAKQFSAILIVDECRRTGSLSEEIMAVCLETLQPCPAIKRLSGEDSFIPLGDAWQYVLPSSVGIVEAALACISK